MIDTYKARRRCQIGDGWREPGEPVPEAHLWRLTDGLVSSGQIEPVQLSEADFEAAVSKYCPDEADAIYAMLGLEPVVRKAPTRRGKPPVDKTVLTTEPVEVSKGG